MSLYHLQKLFSVESYGNMIALGKFEKIWKEAKLAYSDLCHVSTWRKYEMLSKDPKRLCAGEVVNAI
jgi:hypothetical protein